MKYDYECKKCGLVDEFSHPMGESIKKCPSCGSKKFGIVILQAPRCVVNEVRTVGQLADRNWKKMGTYERETKMKEDGVQESIDRSEYNKKMGKLARMTPEQKHKYIHDGTI
jgi:putative FmdB family regulatory protein